MRKPRKTRKTRPFLNPQDLADRWGMDKKTILAAIHRGEIPCAKVGRIFNIPVAWVESQEDLEPAS